MIFHQLFVDLDQNLLQIAHQIASGRYHARFFFRDCLGRGAIREEAM